MTTFTVKTKILHAMLKSVAHAAAVKDARYYLNGIRLETELHTLRLIATDGKRMAVAEMAVPDVVPGLAYTLGGNCKALIETLGSELKKAKHCGPETFVTYVRGKFELCERRPGSEGPDKVRIEEPGKIIVATKHGVSMGLESQYPTMPSTDIFPDWRRVDMKKDQLAPWGGNCQAVNADYLADACKAAGGLANQKYRGVRIHSQPSMCFVTVTSSDGIDYREIIMGMRD